MDQSNSNFAFAGRRQVPRSWPGQSTARPAASQYQQQLQVRRSRRRQLSLGNRTVIAGCPEASFDASLDLSRPGLAKAWHGSRFVKRQHITARHYATTAEDISGLPLNRIRQFGPLLDLHRPDVLEPLLTAVNISYAHYLKDQGVAPDTVAGYGTAKSPQFMWLVRIVRRCSASGDDSWSFAVAGCFGSLQNGGRDALERSADSKRNR